MSAAPLIEARELNHHYGRGQLRRQVLFDIDVAIPQGEIVIVTGPSGSGKTTLLTLVGALRSAQAGSLRVLGEELRGARRSTLERVRRQIGFIFQHHNLLGALTALQNVELGIRVTGRVPAGAVRRRASEMLEAVGLHGHMEHRPGQLSGGQRQRVAIARALAAEPGMMLADEPTASLDKQSGRDVVDRMKYLAQEHGTTILLVTHDHRILDIADRIVHLEDGRLQTFTENVVANNQYMMQMLADNMRKQPVGEVVEDLDEAGFRDMLARITNDARNFMDVTALSNDTAFRSLIEQSLFAFTRRIRTLLNVEQASLWVAERDRESLLLRVADNLPEDEEIRIDLGSGIAGAVAASGESIRVDDPYADPRFNPEVDKRLGFTTRSLLALPIKNRAGDVFAVAQLLNRVDGQPFDDEDERRFEEFVDSVGVVLETLKILTGRRRAGD